MPALCKVVKNIIARSKHTFAKFANGSLTVLTKSDHENVDDLITNSSILLLVAINNMDAVSVLVDIVFPVILDVTYLAAQCEWPPQFDAVQRLAFVNGLGHIATCFISASFSARTRVREMYCAHKLYQVADLQEKDHGAGRRRWDD
ncbi:hypothetical protein M427DRAFT_134360 [Gonapodya prolifera JEL478]|uniref:Uncharacterized protein n=1 Tax=Gonapodya prolifera (strain JEL478) TaxID=1344416 RepID=A0A139AHW0_GONPJ|nr:hypothetical protein M427DRAFT_134360 [Gonapodya prolifera JEL478]|eukprot:KXS16350.1 hypothetical protein M427DRAFT_134360 [Gonapodya prolifera JEL478]